MKKQILRVISAVLVLSMILALPVVAASKGVYSVKVSISGPRYNSNGVKTGEIGKISAETGDKTGDASFVTALTEAFSEIYEPDSYRTDSNTGMIYYTGTNKNSVNYVFIYTNLHTIVDEALTAVKTASAWSAFVDTKAITSSSADKAMLKNLNYTLQNAYDKATNHTVTFGFVSEAGDTYTVVVTIGFEKSDILSVGDEKVSAEVEGTNVIITDTSAEDAVKKDTALVIDAVDIGASTSKKEAEVTSVTMTDALVEKLDNENASLELKLTDNTVKYNAGVIEAIAAKIEEVTTSAQDKVKILQLHEAFNTQVEEDNQKMAEKAFLTAAQEQTIEEIKEDSDVIVVNGCIEVLVNDVSVGELTQADYAASEAEAEIEWTYKYPVSNAKDAEVYYLDKQGNAEPIEKVTVKDGYVTFTINHLSQYIIIPIFEYVVETDDAASVEVYGLEGSTSNQLDSENVDYDAATGVLKITTKKSSDTNFVIKTKDAADTVVETIAISTGETEVNISNVDEGEIESGKTENGYTVKFIAGDVATTNFTVAKATATLEFKQASFTKKYDGLNADIDDLDYTYTGDGKVTVSWYDADGNALEGAPKEVGTYKVSLSAAETDKYSNAASEKATFTIASSGTVSHSSSSSVQLAPEVVTTDGYAKFSDADANAWYNTAMRFCFENGLITGLTDTKLAPNNNITRAQIATILWRYSGAKTASSEANFSDVSGHWAEEAIRWAQSVGLISGYPDGTFKPNNSITRQEMVAMLYRFAKNVLNADTTKTTELTSFTDAANVGTWAAESFQWAVANGVVNGMTATTLAPNGTATRAQFAQIIYKLVK